MARAPRHQSVLQYQKFRYLWVAILFNIVTIAAYAWHVPPTNKPYGGSPLGYAFGTIATLLIVWLAWYGIRKRRYNRGGRVQGWLSAHVYLGVSLIVVTTLHTGFEIGWNVHTLAYALMIIVILSGMYGVWLYLKVPTVITKNMGDETLQSVMLKVADLDRECQRASQNMSDEVNAIVLAAGKSVVGGNWRTQMSARDKKCPTAAAVESLGEIGKRVQGPQAQAFHQLYTLIVRKHELLQLARRDVRYRAQLGFWLYLHVPMTIVLLAALVTHIVAVFFYW